MALQSPTKLGLGGAAIMLVALSGIGFAPTPPTELPTVTVYHDPT